MIIKIFSLLTPPERRRAYLLFIMILVMALLDAVGVASIMPFMAVLASPDVVHSNAYLSFAYSALDFTTTESFLFFLGVMVFVAMLVSITFKAVTNWSLLHFTEMQNYSLSLRLAEGYLYQPYEWFLNRHSADLGKNVLDEVQYMINGALIPLMQAVAQGAVVVSILGLLLFIDPLLVIYLGMGLGVAYGAIYIALRRHLARLGEVRWWANLERYKTMTEAFGGIKVIKIGVLEREFLDRFKRPARRYARAKANFFGLAQTPRYVLEIAAFGGMLLVILYLIRTEMGLQGALPLIALYAVAGYRLLPALQTLYAQLAQLRFVATALNNMHHELKCLAPPATPSPAEPPSFFHSIRIEELSYTYPHATSPAIKGLTLEIPAFTTIGLVGTTGSGKTTTVDIILGLLQPHCGQVLVDGEPIDNCNRRGWQRRLGYVPQQIYLADDSVTANIAFGIPSERVNQEAVERAARIANLHDFITLELPNAYGSLVGERGVRLSGGQRQRIGIARALYHEPQVLILDEATSALDNLTEQAVMDAVQALKHKITIILIAHRLSTVRECDRIYVLDKGQLSGKGTYEELLATNDQFRGMARTAKDSRA